MKKFNRHLVALGLSIGMMCSVNMTAYARPYSLDIPGTFIGSLRSTELFKKLQIIRLMSNQTRTQYPQITFYLRLVIL